MENKAMRQVSADYERVKRAFGPEQVDRILEAAYQQEHCRKGTETGRKVKNSDRRTIITKTGGYSSEYPSDFICGIGKMISCFLERTMIYCYYPDLRSLSNMRQGILK